MVLHINTKDQKIIEVILKENGEVISQKSSGNQFGSQVLLPLIKKMLAEKKLKISDLTEIEVEKGPGSFTGLRVGVSVANALGYSLNIPVNGKQAELDLVY